MAPHPMIEGRTPLTQQEILTHALAIVDSEGLGALSMRRLASELNVEAMALYYHFPNKQAILDGVVNTAVSEAAGGLELPESDDWRTVMRAGILMVRGALLAHPNVVPLVASPAAGSPASAVWVEGPLRILYDAGLRGRELVSAYHQIVAYVMGWHLLASGDKTSVWHGGPEKMPSGLDNGPSLVYELGDDLGDWGDGFEDGLDFVLDGVESARRSQ